MPSEKRKKERGQLAALIENSQQAYQEAAKLISLLDRKKENSVSYLADEQLSMATGQLFRQLSKTTGQFPEQLSKTTGQLQGQPDNWTTGQLPGQLDIWTTGQLHKKNIPVDLTTKQYSVLRYIYFNRPFSVHSKSGQSKMQIALRLAYQTIRNNIKILISKGYIEKPYIINGAGVNAQTCRVNIEKCNPLFGPSGIPEPIPKYGQLDNWTTGQLPEQQDNRTTGQLEPPIVDSFLKKLSTESNFFKEYFGEKPHLKFWLDRGLSGKNLSDWAQKCSCDLKTLLRYMDRCRFEMVDMGRETKHTDSLKPIENVLSYFWKIISNTGYYPESSEYVSPEQRQCEEAKMATRALEEENKALEAALGEKREAELKNIFLRHFENTNSEIYKKCYEKMNAFMLKPENKNKPERFFRNMFTAFVGMVDNGEISI